MNPFPRASREDRLTVVRAWAGLLALGSSYSPRLPGSLASGSRGFRPRSQWRGRGGFAPPSLGPLWAPWARATAAH